MGQLTITTAQAQEKLNHLVIPNQTNFVGTMIVGDGGTHLDNTGTDAGDFNLIVGIGAGTDQTIAKRNTLIGWNAGAKITSGWANTFVGYNSGSNGVGTGSLDVSGDGVEFYANTAIGEGTFYSATTASYCVAIGNNALGLATTAKNCVAVGVHSLQSVTSAVNNVGLGRASGYNLTTGGYNLAIGFEALFTRTTGVEAVAIGTGAGFTDNAPAENIYIGNNSGYYQTTGTHNTIVGADAGKGTASYRGWYQSLFGYRSGYVLGADAEGNVGVGYLSLQRITTGTYNTFIGAKTGQNASQLATATNSICIGNDTYTTASNTGVIGNASVTDIYFGSVSGAAKIHASKARFTNIPTSASGLSAGDVWSNSGVLTIV